MDKICTFLVRASSFLKHLRFVWKRPGLILRILRNYFKVLVLRKPVLRSI